MGANLALGLRLGANSLGLRLELGLGVAVRDSGLAPLAGTQRSIDEVLLGCFHRLSMEGSIQPSSIERRERRVPTSNSLHKLKVMNL